jgi:hypothetical protein
MDRHVHVCHVLSLLSIRIVIVTVIVAAAADTDTSISISINTNTRHELQLAARLQMQIYTISPAFFLFCIYTDVRLVSAWSEETLSISMLFSTPPGTGATSGSELKVRYACLGTGTIKWHNTMHSLSAINAAMHQNPTSTCQDADTCGNNSQMMARFMQAKRHATC